jgi:hypothetical protein
MGAVAAGKRAQLQRKNGACSENMGAVAPKSLACKLGLQASWSARKWAQVRQKKTAVSTPSFLLQPQ